LLEFNNFNGINQILACLLSPGIQKLKNAWMLPSQKSKEDLFHLTTLMHPDGHYHNYEEAIHAVNDTTTSCVPFLTPPKFVLDGCSAL